MNYRAGVGKYVIHLNLEISMSSYDNFRVEMQERYDAAIAKLAELDKEREEVLKIIEYLSSICGKKTYTLENLKEPIHAPAKKVGRGAKKVAVCKASCDKKATEGKKPRIKTEVLMGLVMKCLEEAPGSLSANEILCKLVEAGLERTDSFQTRVYSKLSEWTKSGLLIKPDRGVYQIAPKNND